MSWVPRVCTAAASSPGPELPAPAQPLAALLQAKSASCSTLCARPLHVQCNGRTSAALSALHSPTRARSMQKVVRQAAHGTGHSLMPAAPQHGDGFAEKARQASAVRGKCHDEKQCLTGLPSVAVPLLQWLHGCPLCGHLLPCPLLHGCTWHDGWHLPLGGRCVHSPWSCQRAAGSNDLSLCAHNGPKIFSSM